MSSHQENDIAPLGLGALHQLRELRRVHGTPGRIQKYFERRGVAAPIETARIDLPHFAGYPASGALQKLLGDRVGMLVSRFADEIKEDSQSSIVARGASESFRSRGSRCHSGRCDRRAATCHREKRGRCPSAAVSDRFLFAPPIASHRGSAARHRAFAR